MDAPRGLFIRETQLFTALKINLVSINYISSSTNIPGISQEVVNVPKSITNAFGNFSDLYNSQIWISFVNVDTKIACLKL